MRRHAIYETEALAAALDQDGYACIASALPSEVCDQARLALDALQPRHWDQARGAGGALERYLCVFNRDAYWLRFLDRPGVIELAESVLGADCHVIGETAWRSHPGFTGQGLHVDYLPLTWDEGVLPPTVRIPAFILTVHFYLNTVTADLAPTHVVPGSHRAGRAPRAGERAWRGTPAKAVLAHAGDALVFRSDLWHAGGQNASESDVRYLLQVHYGRREMAQHFSPFMDWCFDQAILACASKRQRRLLGDHEPGAYD